MLTRVRWRNGLLAVLTLGTIGFAVWTASVGLNRSTTAATMVSLLFAAASLALAVVQTLPGSTAPRVDPVAAAAGLGDDIRRQWLDEAAARSVDTGTMLPVTWAVEVSDVADRRQPQHPWRSSGTGAIDGDFLTAAGEIAGEYRRVENGRLLVLGQPGAGKTVVAMLLTVGLLPIREPSRANPVPVLLSAAALRCCTGRR